MMKKMSIAILLILGLFLTACSSNGDGDKKEEPNNEQGAPTSDTETSTDSSDSKEGNIYQIGETAQTETSSLGYPYEVTVNSFEITEEDVEGHSLESYNLTAEEGSRFAVVNVTIKNTGEKSFVPNRQLSGELVYASSNAAELDYDFDFFLERDEELAPGDEITGNLVYTSRSFFEEDTLYLVYEYLAKEEIRIELPVPKE
ncbi:DUF4352 domain-containing protein [Virgibacillus soli]|uniref:DUF4352 domain-containing protein n=1 Tax=Paracerasibacillus soli TaxID=480284 RepID=UPI0035ED5276